MKHATLLAALICGSATTALAGGYTAPVVESEPAVAVVPATADWTGFYGGVQLGGAELSQSLPGTDDVHLGLEGRHYGLHVGYLRDYGQFVAGGELSYDKLDDFDGGFFGPGDFDGNVIRAKLLAGYDSGRFLPYAAVSFARMELESGGISLDDTGFGFGVGAKFLATPRVMLGVEWMTNEFEFGEGPASVDFDLGTVSLSASYRF